MVLESEGVIKSHIFLSLGFHGTWTRREATLSMGMAKLALQWKQRQNCKIK